LWFLGSNKTGQFLAIKRSIGVVYYGWGKSGLGSLGWTFSCLGFLVWVSSPNKPTTSKIKSQPMGLNLTNPLQWNLFAPSNKTLSMVFLKYL
jgi:hypothetical protein